VSEAATAQVSHPVNAPTAVMKSRYPGSVPFQDDPFNRHLFFGRKAEADVLFNNILVENLVVLYSRSGLGKTSLLNAGVLWRLRERRFFPIMCRVYAPLRNGTNETVQGDPLQALYFSIDREIDKALLPENNLLIKPPQGRRNTLWEYFKTAEFLVAENVHLTPILILDQFEELFTQYKRDQRQDFARQLGDLVRGSIPESLLKHYETQVATEVSDFPYSEDPPKVKVVIAMREEYLGNLAELAIELPSILKNEFRLQPLDRENARSAIEEPAKLEIKDTTWQGTPTFTYTPDTLKGILDFLCNPKESPEEVEEDEVDPNQLQLLCHYIEEVVRDRARREGRTPVVVDSTLVGGRAEMRAIIDNFYRRVLGKIVPSAKRRRVEDLCENGLISPAGRRLSVAEEHIANQFKVFPPTLKELEDLRLVRSDFRLGDFYYELSHDTLIQPILESKRRHERLRKIRNWAGVVVLAVAVGTGIWVGIDYYSSLTAKDIAFNVMKGKEALQGGDFTEAEARFKKASEEGGGTHAEVRNGWGQALAGLANLKPQEASQLGSRAEAEYQAAITLAKHKNDNDLPQYFLHLGNLYIYQHENEKAIKTYKEIIKLSEKPKHKISNTIMAECYLGLGRAYLGMNGNGDNQAKLKEYAMLNLQNMEKYRDNDTLSLLKLSNRTLGNVYDSNKEYQKAIEQYRKSLISDPDNAITYLFISQAYLNTGDYGKARQYWEWANDGVKVNATYFQGPILEQIADLDNKLKQHEQQIPDRVSQP
jgi:tetratricopeptide (TPR) repeat protein